MTATMTAFARSMSLTRDSAIQTVGFTLAFAAIIPGIFSVAFFVEHRLLNRATAIIWAIFLGLGGLLVFGLLHDARLMSRDLAGGVYVRWTGPFTTRLISTRAGTAVQVEVDGRKLPSTFAPSLNPVRSGVGTVDYLPTSGTLLEVQDGHDRVLWRRLPDGT